MVVVYVEGGGDTQAQRTPLRRALGQFLEKALPGTGGRPRVEVWGGRQRAFEKFRRGLQEEPNAFHVLLVDSESPVGDATPWEHVRRRPGDGWEAPDGAGEANLHFMIQAMEAWLCADPDALAAYFGPGFKADKLPQRAILELVPKADLNAKLDDATRGSRRGRYRKGAHLDLLGFVSPDRVRQRCPSVATFLRVVEEHR